MFFFVCVFPHKCPGPWISIKVVQQEYDLQAWQSPTLRGCAAPPKVWQLPPAVTAATSILHVHSWHLPKPAWLLGPGRTMGGAHLLSLGGRRHSTDSVRWSACSQHRSWGKASRLDLCTMKSPVWACWSLTTAGDMEDDLRSRWESTSVRHAFIRKVRIFLCHQLQPELSSRFSVKSVRFLFCVQVYIILAAQLAVTVSVVAVFTFV